MQVCVPMQALAIPPSTKLVWKECGLTASHSSFPREFYGPEHLEQLNNLGIEGLGQAEMVGPVPGANVDENLPAWGSMS